MGKNSKDRVEKAEQEKWPTSPNRAFKHNIKL